MIEGEENVVLSVPIQHLTEFANNLFGYLYLGFDMSPQDLRTRYKKFNGHFNHVIGSAVLLIEKNVWEFNKKVLERFFFEVDSSTLCQNLCTSYPNFDYFKKLYYTTAFIIDLLLFWNMHTDTVNFSVGPNLWIKIFQTNFDSVFEVKGGWRGFTAAGQLLLDSANKDGSILQKDILMPNYFWAFISGPETLIPKYDETASINMYEIVDALRRVRGAPIVAVGPLENENVQIEEAEINQPEQVVENPDIPHVAVGGRRKRKHDADPRDLEPDMGPFLPSKPKVDNTR